jgi:hypothetical protein
VVGETRSVEVLQLHVTDALLTLDLKGLKRVQYLVGGVHLGGDGADLMAQLGQQLRFAGVDWPDETYIAKELPTLSL